MKILFTGGSSFTGHWFIRELARAGHDVVATLRQKAGAYSGTRQARVESLGDTCHRVEECSFGDAQFLRLIEGSGTWDLLCHHAADVTDYRSPDFDVAGALGNNTRNLRSVLHALLHSGCRRVVVTGTVFEEGEGAGSDGLPAFSPYGVSKGLTAHVFRHETRDCGMRMGKFVIPNPFGPFEEARFTSYLARTWFQGETASVNTPDYVRDNIPVSLLAKAYARFAEQLGEAPGYEKINPSGYVESQGCFTHRMAREMRQRLDMPCHVDLKEQTEFSEPRVRINTDPLDSKVLDWSESSAWDDLADYYRKVFA